MTSRLPPGRMTLPPQKPQVKYWQSHMVITLGNVPAGEYTLEAWHEKYGTVTQKVTVEDGKTVEVNFTFKK